jgi:hypothetical protein
MREKSRAGRKGQFTTEYLIIVSIALLIIGFFLIYVFVYYSSYYNASVASKVSTTATSLVKEANYVTNEGLGSKISFSLTVPQLTLLGSFFCGNFVKVSSGTYSYIQNAKLNIVGILPMTPGNYIMYAMYNNSDRVQIGFEADITYINYSYSISGNTLNYNIEFFGSKHTPTALTAYNISVFTYGGQYINSTRSVTNADGVASSSIHLNQVPATLLVYIFALGTNVVAPSCLQT